MMSDDTMMSVGEGSVVGNDSGGGVGSVSDYWSSGDYRSGVSDNTGVVRSDYGTTRRNGGDGATVGTYNGGPAAGSLDDLGTGASQEGEESNNSL